MSYRIVLATATSLMVATIIQANDESAIEALRRAGATVIRDDDVVGKPVVKVGYNLRQVTADGVQAIKDLEELPAVEFAGSGDTEISVETLRALQGKKSLKQFAISHAKVSDEAAKILGTLSSLQILRLKAQVELSPTGLSDLLKLPNLRELALADRLATDETLSQIATLTNLKTLSVKSVFITDGGMAHLRRLTNLQKLQILIGPDITNVGLGHLATLNLTDLEITLLNVTDEKLKSVGKLYGLKSLSFINATGVTDDGVPLLVELKELKKLDLADAQLSKAGIKELKRALPKCAVEIQTINRK